MSPEVSFAGGQVADLVVTLSGAFLSEVVMFLPREIGEFGDGAGGGPA